MTAHWYTSHTECTTFFKAFPEFIGVCSRTWHSKESFHFHPCSHTCGVSVVVVVCGVCVVCVGVVCVGVGVGCVHVGCVHVWCVCVVWV